MDSWSYQLSAGEGVARINDFHLVMKTDFDGSIFRRTRFRDGKHKTANGWD